MKQQTDLFIHTLAMFNAKEDGHYLNLKTEPKTITLQQKSL